MTVSFESDPPGARVFRATDSSVEIGTTPVRRVSLRRGEQRFVFRLEGYEDAEVTFHVTTSGQTVRATLSQLSELAITGSNDGARGATVSVQGESWGGLPVRRWVRPGRYLVIVSRDGYQAFQRWVDLARGQALALPVQLERVPARTGSISVVADAEGALVFLNGQQRGASPCLIEDVPEGEHVLEIRAEGPGVRPLRQTVVVAAGRTSLVTPQVRVTPRLGALRVISNTPGAIIRIDGEVVGVSPQQRDVAEGEHVVRVTADGYQPSVQTVEVVAGRQRVIMVNLTRVGPQGRIEVSSPAPGATAPTTPVAPVASPCPPNMVRIPGGTFRMGSTDGQANEQPVHQVTLSAYCLDRTEVTVAAYARCVSAGACLPAPTTVSWFDISEADLRFYSQLCNGNRGDRQDHPVNCVDWNQAATYCSWAGGRLPTEAEWEYAARGADGRPYPWGFETPNAGLLNACGPECSVVTWVRRSDRATVIIPHVDGHGSPGPVGSYPDGAGPFGNLDLAGNVWEWVSDWYGMYPSGPVTDPSGASSSQLRAYRDGGSIVQGPARTRASTRFGGVPDSRVSSLGFRCARGVPR